jgi:WD40 repeat protein
MENKMKKLFLSISLLITASHPAFAMDAALKDRDAIMHDFLHNHERFKATWGTIEERSTSYLRLPKEITQNITYQSLVPALPMLKKIIQVQSTTVQNRTCGLRAERRDYRLHIYDEETNSWVATIGDANQIDAHSFNKTGSRLIVAWRYGNTEIWDTTNLRNYSKSLQKKALRGHTESVTHTDFNDDSTLAVTSSRDCTAKIWNVNTGKCIHTLRGHNGPIGCAHFNPTSTILATNSADTTVKLWNIESGICLYTLGHTDCPQFCFNKDGNLIATATPQGIVRLWESQTGNCIQEINTGIYSLTGLSSISSLDFNEQSTLLATTTKNCVKIWNLKSGKCILTLKESANKFISNEGISDAHFSPPTGNLIIKQVNKTAKEYNLHAHLNVIEFLEKSLSFEQALLLNCIYQTALTNKLAKKRSNAANHKLNFNDFPHLQIYFDGLPQEIQHGLAAFVILVAPKQEEDQDDDLYKLLSLARKQTDDESDENEDSSHSDAADKQECIIL